MRPAKEEEAHAVTGQDVLRVRAAKEEEAHAATEQEVVPVVFVEGRRVVVVVAVADDVALPLADAGAVDAGSTTRTMPS